ncbi:uncharacterized protein LOC130666292 [Microplitis mediator]|uniref:uncharacterized protein LOC130666292 n=1 Tax=Microplitis mediator TaxID=375433 RepID=UPI002556AF1C|nr:uncharacterized protein LOC130666292 [Microplitis mediator]XP_057323111.1 uncharacterized protein LOC130666292 [Microplitis mediator]
MQSKILNMTWALPFVPTPKFAEAVQIICNMIEVHEESNPNFIHFRQYIRNVVAPQIDKICMWNTPWQALTLAEDFNHNLLSHLGELHPTMFTFIKKMSTYINQTARVLSSRLTADSCMVMDFIQIIGVWRGEISKHLHIAVDRQQYLYDDLASTSSRFDLLGNHYLRQDGNIGVDNAELQPEAVLDVDDSEPQEDVGPGTERQPDVNPGIEPQPDNPGAELQLEESRGIGRVTVGCKHKCRQ